MTAPPNSSVRAPSIPGAISTGTIVTRTSPAFRRRVVCCSITLSSTIPCQSSRGSLASQMTTATAESSHIPSSFTDPPLPPTTGGWRDDSKAATIPVASLGSKASSNTVASPWCDRDAVRPMQKGSRAGSGTSHHRHGRVAISASARCSICRNPPSRGS